MTGSSSIISLCRVFDYRRYLTSPGRHARNTSWGGGDSAFPDLNHFLPGQELSVTWESRIIVERFPGNKQLIRVAWYLLNLLLLVLHRSMWCPCAPLTTSAAPCSPRGFHFFSTCSSPSNLIFFSPLFGGLAQMNISQPFLGGCCCQCGL